MKNVLELLDRLVSIPINWLTQQIKKATDRKRAEFWRQQEILRQKLGPEHAKEMDEIDAAIREWDEKQKQ